MLVGCFSLPALAIEPGTYLLRSARYSHVTEPLPEPTPCDLAVTAVVSKGEVEEFRVTLTESYWGDCPEGAPVSTPRSYEFHLADTFSCGRSYESKEQFLPSPQPRFPTFFANDYTGLQPEICRRPRSEGGYGILAQRFLQEVSENSLRTWIQF